MYFGTPFLKRNVSRENAGKAMSTSYKIRMIITIFSIAVLWILVLVVMAQKNRIEDAETNAVSLRSDVMEIKTLVNQGRSGEPGPSQDAIYDLDRKLRDLEERFDDLNTTVRTIPDHSADIADLSEEMTETRETVGNFNKALRGLQLSIEARSR